MRKAVLAILYCVLMRSFLRLIVGVKYFNADAPGKCRQFVIVSNHNSHLDTMALMSVLGPSQLVKTHPVAAGDYFGQSRLRAFFTRYLVNAILIPRAPGKGEHNPIRLMSEALKKGDSLILFPEGSRGEPEKMQAFKKGIGMLMKLNPGVPVVPVYMKGMGKVLPKGENLLVPFDSYVCFGEPLIFKGAGVDEIVEEIEHEILNLCNRFFPPAGNSTGQPAGES